MARSNLWACVQHALPFSTKLPRTRELKTSQSYPTLSENTLKTETTIYIMTKSWPVSKNVTLYLFLYIYLGSYHIIFFLLFHFLCVFLLVFLFRFNVEPLYLIYVWLCFAKLFRC